MPDLDIKYTSDPNGDIVSRPVQVYFGQRAISETVAVNVTSSTGMFSSVEKSTLLKTETISEYGDLIQTCLGVTIVYTILSQQVHYTDSLGFSWARGARSYTTYVPGELNIKISWDAKKPTQENNEDVSSTPNTGGAMPDISPENKTIILRSGFHIKCRDLTDIQYYANGEICGEDYINPLIPDITHGERIGKNLIFESLKNANIQINTVPNFKIKPRQFIKSPISYLFFNETFKIEAVELQAGEGAEQSFVIHTRGRKY